MQYKTHTFSVSCPPFCHFSITSITYLSPHLSLRTRLINNTLNQFSDRVRDVFDLNRKYMFYLLNPCCMDVPTLGFATLPCKELLCFLHEWGLHPSYVTDNGGNVGGNVGGKNGSKNGNVPSLSLACPQLCPQLCHKSCHKTKKRMQVLMQKMQPPVQRLQPWMKRLQVWSQRIQK